MSTHYGTWGLDVAAMQSQVAPGDNFYRYANGSYLDHLILPPDRSLYTEASVLTDTVLIRLRDLLTIDPVPAESCPDGKLPVSYYASFMNEAAVERAGLRPVVPELQAIRSSRTRADLARLMAKENSSFYASLFSLSILPDLKDPYRYSVSIGQPDLGLPDLSFYFDGEHAQVRAAYREYVEALLRAVDWPSPSESAQAILKLESDVASVNWSADRRRDSHALYNPIGATKLATTAPGFPWSEFLSEAGVGSPAQVVLLENTAIIQIASLSATVPLDTLRAWLAFNVLDRAAPYLSSPVRERSFSFRGGKLGGRTKPVERWKAGLRLVGSSNSMTHMESIANVGDAVAQCYVARYFDPEARRQVELIVSNVKTALQQRLNTAPWLSEGTKAEGLRKLQTYSIEIGYPDHRRSFGQLQLSPEDLIGNIRRAAAYNWQYEVSRLQHPVDRFEWPVQPHVVNAYNDAVLRLIVFTAALLSPPVFDPQADAAVNYGAIGAIVGHELTHGFDDQGRRFDSSGAITNWWTATDEANFNVRAALLVKQFNECEVLPGKYVNGKLTLGENLADLGGLVIALDAYHATLGGRPAPVLDGLTGDQRFFLSYAQQRRGKFRPEALLQQIITDRHAPDECRVNMEVRNLDAWYAAFGVESTDRLYVAPADRVTLW